MMTTPLRPGADFPVTSVPRIGGGRLELGKPSPGFDWQVIVVYRGKHCPICTRYLTELNAVRPDLEAIGIEVVAVSADAQDLALQQLAEVSPTYTVGYDLSVEQMQSLGLFITAPNPRMPVERPFAEPAVLVVDEAGQVRMIDISNVPFMRPDLSALMRGLKFVCGQGGSFPVTGSHA